MATPNLIFTHDVAAELTRLLDDLSSAGVFVLADSNTAPLVAQPLIDAVERLDSDSLITIPAGDDHKTVDTLTYIWSELSSRGATRHSMLINVGGGMVTDIGGFAASTFKRGIRSVNVATSLLGAVDASLGGKTGINFAGLKNEIGAFHEAEAVVISTGLFKTLPHGELLSGYAELLKHALINSGDALDRALSFDLEYPDWHRLQQLLKESVEVKRRIVSEDPREHGIRKALNLGHTVAHAIESLSMQRGKPVAHGYAVAVGLVADMVLSNIKFGFPSDTLSRVAHYIKTFYPAPDFSCSDYPLLVEKMRHDKKNRTATEINFTLLQSPGHIVIDCNATVDEIQESLDITRDLLS